ncbi:MAG: TetR/AcrR family transcriptional regulator [Deltaproteobacteria bacterium]|nr:TetR/AcrR family transcriptional regulator [Deltaproteobacteria bacterium]
MHVLQAGGKAQSWRELAKAAAVDPTTLRHYFGDRRGLVRAVYESLQPIGRMRRDLALALLEKPAKDAFATLLKQVASAWPMVLGGMHALGFSEGFADADLGQAYVALVLEPTLVTFEEMLAHYAGKGELSVPDMRVAALALAAPVLLGLFHQHQLSGSRCRPLDVDVYIDAHLAGFFSGYAQKE